MSKTRWWIVVLVTLLALVVLGAGGFAAYQIGLNHGTRVTVVEKQLPQRFLDRLESEDGRLGIFPRLKMREFNQRLLFHERIQRDPFSPSWLGIIMAVVLLAIFVILVVLLIVTLTSKKNGQSVVVQAPPPPPLSGTEPEQKD